MAEAAISFAVEALGNLMIEKVGFLRGVDGEVEWVQRELRRMQGFLKDASEKQANDERIRRWISEIRELAQDAEDVIETFVLHVENPRRSRGLLGRCACFPCHLHRLNELGNEVKSIKTRLEDIIKSRETYKIENIQGSSSRSNTIAERRRLYPWQKDKHLVGVDEDVKLLLQRAILEEKEGLSVASIVGMGGIGKSTLARALYNHSEVARRFDRRAWVVVSDQFNLSETIKELVLQLLGPDENKQEVLRIMKDLPKQNQKSMLHELLKGRRYFIVVDDVWRQQDWESLASAFPDEEDTTIRLIVTSRHHNIPRRARYVHEMKTLDPNKSWELLLKAALGDGDNIGRCRRELEDIGKEILTKCNGLPLAIMVVGGLLLEQRQSRTGWEKVLQQINFHLGTSGSSSIQAILELSYHDLPPHLKSCFLCLGFFKEDTAIRADKLIHIWIAEGLISHEQRGQTMEETGRGYLDELINRNMVQVKELSKKDDRVIKSCQIHDLLRELSIKKANEEINFVILKKDQGDSSSTPLSLGHKPRHCATYYSTECFNIFSTRSLRSLFFHGDGGDDADCSNPSYKWKSFRRLRVLDMDGLELIKLPDAIGELVGLRYLGLRNSQLRKLPSSLGRLKNLQVLNIGYRYVEVPNIIWKMDSLRHIYIYIIFCEVPLKVDNLKNLQTLMYIPAASLVEQSTQMTSLRKLGIVLNKDVDVRKLCTSLGMLENLACLNLRIGHMPFPDGLVLLHHVTQLKLQGQLTNLHSANEFPPNLIRLTLKYSRVKEDLMPVLEKLPKLLYLKLDYAYYGEEMEISSNGFPNLEVLILVGLFKLRNIKVGKGGMSNLKRLMIIDCPKLTPEELRFMTDLQELKIVTTP